MEHSDILFSQLAILGILGGSLILFVKDRWRYDVVALLVMVGVVMVGALPYDQALANFGHPAVIIVAAMFVMSQALVRSGLVDSTIGKLSFMHKRPILALSLLVIMVAFLSAFVNNVGALAMVMPIAIQLAKKSKTPVALFLLPLAFASHLGGFMTLIGTPRNLIVSDFRYQELGQGYQMFDFFHVGGVLALLGVLFLILIAWRLLPRNGPTSPETFEEKHKFNTEVTVTETSKISKYSVKQLNKFNKENISFNKLFRNNTDYPIDEHTKFLPGDRILLLGNTDALNQFIAKYSLTLSGIRSQEWHVTSADDHGTVEGVVTPYSAITGKTWNELPIQNRYGTNFIAFARRGHVLSQPLDSATIWPGDVLLFQGRVQSIKETLSKLGVLTTDEHEIPLGRTRTILATLSIIIGAITLASFNIFPLAFIFLIATILLVIFDLVSLKQAYDSIDFSILILLAGMLTLGEALQQSGAAGYFATALMSLDNLVAPIVILFLILIFSMILSDFMNATASVVIMAPIAILMANNMEVSIDPFLMVVAIGSSCAFLTPVGHESNALVMQKGGYKFKDYLRIGLPLELLVLATSVPLVLYFWPL